MTAPFPPPKKQDQGQDIRYPAGWWMVPLLFISVFCWALLFVLFF